MMSLVRILLIDVVDEDNTVVVMSQSFLILRSLPVPPGEMKTDQQIARIVRYSLQCKAVQFNPDVQKDDSRTVTHICSYWQS